ncbi:hypothetical protein N0V90_005450 [Kalmusia sp. IMI 367209]|nr:hypothetical protein N0V90_005450 [Kalmusia sp. IMI 367209]
MGSCGGFTAHAAAALVAPQKNKQPTHYLHLSLQIILRPIDNLTIAPAFLESPANMWHFFSSENSKRRIPEEKGPFGKARKRGVSRSKTPNISSAQDLAKQENLKAIDDIFARYKADDKQRSLRKSSSSQLPVTTSAPNLLDAGGLSASLQSGAPVNGTKVSKEVIIFGFGKDQQWAAINKFEEISKGCIYEEYERGPRDSKFSLSFTPQRASQFNKLSGSARAKINEYVGGEHWIKVTFDSVEAADLAIYFSPHTIGGFEVRVEEYRGMGPNVGDVAVPAGRASVTASPNTMSSATMQGGASQSSATASSATATSGPASTPARRVSKPRLGAFLSDDEDTPARDSLASGSQSQSVGQTTSSQSRPPGRSTLRLKGSKSRPFLQGDKVFLPARPKWQETLGQFPIIGWVVGSGNGLIGDQVPRKEDGTFDSSNASLYWRTWYMVDSCFGTDFCGVKEAEFEE